ncbi:hypothetical protein [Oceanobacillus sp. J11TS1]|uniref:hypothetical protein n=1 Tax=Oceanobacillus sp. J11TS1 TaxID=2807191 RepID=UPI001B0B262A|nr:hypothetical protein [Oceanobacillus sp. J11TS1]GIO25082.1 hypothetical protein J11TS1_36630 [Oceanobacillus sp. J11TS1]
MSKLESLNGSTVMQGDGTLNLEGANFRGFISDESLGTNMGIVSGTLREVKGLKFKIVDTPVQWKQSLGFMFGFNGSEIGIQISIAEKNKDKLEEIQGKIIEALKNAE